MTPKQYCQHKVAASGSSFYYSFLFLPADIRRDIMALYAFCRAVDDVVDDMKDPAVAQQKLNWWRHEIQATFQQRATHPITREIQRIMDYCPLEQPYFEAMIDGMQMDLSNSRYPDMQALIKYCYQAGSTTGLIAARLFGYEEVATEAYAHDLGIAFQLTNIIRDVKEDAKRQRIYLPSDLLAKHGVDEQAILNGQDSDLLRGALLELAVFAETYYQSAIAKLPEVDRWKQRSGLVMYAIYHALLQRIREQDFAVMQGKIELSRWSKLWIALQSARQEIIRHRRYLKQQHVD